MNCGNNIAYFFGLGYGHAATPISGRSDALKVLQLTSEQIPKHADQYLARLQQAKSLYNVTV